MSSKPRVVVVIIPLPAQGHLNSLLHLAHLITTYGIPVHYAGSTAHNRQAKHRLQGRESESLIEIQFHDFKIPAYSTPPPDPSYPVHLLPLFEASTHLRQPVFLLLQQLSTNFEKIIVIFDSNIASVVQDVKLIPNAESYAFFAVSAFTLFSSSWEGMPKKPFQLDSDIIPGCTPSHRGLIPPEILNFLASQFKFLGSESGRLYNTSRVIEGRYIELLEKLSVNDSMKHFAIGPLNPTEVKNESVDKKHPCLKWLDQQEKASVIYISFGSTTSLTEEQIKEMTTGLERSEQKFIWVLRRADRGDIVAGSEVDKPLLPEGFEERIRNQGLVVRDWAPQLQILAHPSTGGFMSHCGWNSCMESITMGVPIAAWPMHSDQPKNSILVTDILRVGIMVRDSAKLGELVASISIENAVKTLMASKEGQQMRKQAAELAELVRKAAATGNSSSTEMDAFIAHITR